MSEQQFAMTPFKPILLDLLHQALRDQDAFLQKLSDSERAAIGTPDRWSSKDHVAHIVFWQQRTAAKLQAALRDETPADIEKTVEQLNSQIFEERRLIPWSEMLLEAEQASNTLINLIQQCTEEDLVAFHRFAWIRNGEPLCSAIVDSIYEHILAHLAQYYLERHDLSQATRLYESWTARVVQDGTPKIVQGQLLYNLACFYATHAQLEKASVSIQQALSLYPPFKDFALSDPDLIALREQLV